MLGFVRASVCTRLDAGKKCSVVGLGWSRKAVQRGQKVGEMCLISGAEEVFVGQLSWMP